MRLDLREIIDSPGSSKGFEFSPEFDEGTLDPAIGMSGPATMSGTVRNAAGLLTLSGVLQAELVYACSRCACEFTRQLELPVELTLAEELQDDENPDIWLVDDNFLDLEDIALTVFVLNMDTKPLCREDCKGLCTRCGKNLNDGPCDCKPELDPRLAVLEQLLKDNK